MRLHPAVPPRWRVVRTSELLSFVTSGSRGWAQYYSDNGSPFIRIGDLQRGTLSVAWQSAQRVSPPATTEGSRTRVQPGDVLISITADLGVVGVVPDGLPEAFVNQHVALARPTNAVLPRYLGWFLDAESGGQRQFRELRRGATKAGLGLDDIRSIDVPLPQLDHQRQIVAAIETHFSRLDAAVASLTRAKANVKRARASVLKAAVEGRLVPSEAALARAEGRTYEPASVLLDRVLAERKAAWAASGARGRYKEPVKPETDGLPALPEGWCWASMDALAQVVGGITKDSKQTEGRLVPYLRVANVQRGRLELSEIKTILATDAKIDALRLQPGDVLLNEGGDRDKLGRGWVWRGEIPECIHQNHVFRARLWLPDFDSRYLSHYANTEGDRYFLKEGKQTTNLASISLSKVKALPVALPPKAEIDRILAEADRRLSVLDALDAALDANLARSSRLRQSILKRAFEGRLVQQERGRDTTGRTRPASEVHAR